MGKNFKREAPLMELDTLGNLQRQGFSELLDDFFVLYHLHYAKT